MSDKSIILSISTRRSKEEKPFAVQSCTLIKDHGLEGDCSSGPGDRQVTFMSREAKEYCDTNKEGLCARKFTASFVTDGLDYSLLKKGSRITLGGCEVEITGAGKRCFDECAIHSRGMRCPLTRDTAFGKVISGGTVNCGDPVKIRNMRGSVVAVNISTRKGTIKEPVSEGHLIRDFGLENDAHAGNWHRQVSLLAQESIDKMTALGASGLSPGRFAENITTQGLELYSLPVGTRMLIGSAEAEITQIGKECHHHCEIYKQLGMCIMPLEGIFVKILNDAVIRPGDVIEIL